MSAAAKAARLTDKQQSSCISSSEALTAASSLPMGPQGKPITADDEVVAAAVAAAADDDVADADATADATADANADAAAAVDDDD